MEFGLVRRTSSMNEFEQAWAKIKMNSEYPRFAAKEPFRLYDPDLTASITASGTEAFNALMAEIEAVIAGDA